jgi:hypothetical protein
MITLALTLTILGIADLATGGMAAAAGQMQGRAYRISLVLVLCLLGAGAALAYTASVRAATALLVVTVVGTITWVEARASTEPARAYPRLALAALAITVVLSALWVPVWAEAPAPAWISDYLGRLPWRQLHELGSGPVVLTLATLLFLGPTGNGIVRACLQLIRETPVAEAEQELKGGRFIGPLERYLIFGLALAGQPTAAALVISAKSIIRFPELQSKSAVSDAAEPGPDGRRVARPVDVLTEYFLLGSLLSWSLALLAALPLLSLD